MSRKSRRNGWMPSLTVFFTLIKDVYARRLHVDYLVVLTMPDLEI